VPHLKKSLAQFNKNLFHQKFSHKDRDYRNSREFILRKNWPFAAIEKRSIAYFKKPFASGVFTL